MKNDLLLDKPLGMTPLACIESWRARHPEYSGVKMGYAGRLDPMAEGLLVVLVGDENKLREKYLGLDKEYQVTIACGVSTDTHDVMGLIEASKPVLNVPSRDVVEAILQSFRGDIIQEYPAYSSKTVQGKPLYAWAREGRLHDIEMPTAQRHISELELIDIKMVDAQSFVVSVHDKLSRVTQGDFRLDAIEEAWKSWEQSVGAGRMLCQISLRVVCSSGTYMRTLAYEIGKALGYPSCASAIKRTRVGQYVLPPAGQ